MCNASVNKHAPPNRRRTAKRIGLWALGALSLLYLIYATGMFFYQDRILFQIDPDAPKLEGPLPDERIIQYERPLPDGGQVVAWFAPAPSCSPEHPAPLAIFCHGNGGIIDYQDAVIDRYHRFGCSVLLPEYRGYGRADGVPSERGIIEDAVYFRDEVAKRADVDPQRIFIHGQSLGGAVAAGIAAGREPPVLILDSAFTSISSMASKYLFPGFLVKNPFRTDRIVQKLDVPLLLFHGTRDTIVPVSHGRALRDLARNVRYVEYECHHVCQFYGPLGSHDPDAFWSEIERFLIEHAIIPKANTP